LKLNLFNNNFKFLYSEKKILEKQLKKIAFLENCEINILNIIFVSDRTILLLNKKFLKHYYPTDIITFNYSNTHFLTADFFISCNTVKYNSEKFKVSFKSEIYRVIIHGLLHAIGYNDKSKRDYDNMKRLENLYLNLFIDAG
jgi:probable rRNA maturation factor